MGKRGRGSRLCPLPEDFAENAGRRNMEIAVLYGVGMSTVAKWRSEAGLPGAKGRGPQKARPGATDSDAEMEACLTCPAMSCSHGDCERRRRAALA